MDRARVEKLFQKYPKLVVFITAGTITLKAARTILDVDRWLMYDIFTELLEAGAVVGTGATSWRASKDLVAYMEVRNDVRGSS